MKFCHKNNDFKIFKRCSNQSESRYRGKINFTQSGEILPWMTPFSPVSYHACEPTLNVSSIQPDQGDTATFRNLVAKKAKNKNCPVNSPRSA